MIESVTKDIKTINITVFRMFMVFVLNQKKIKFKKLSLDLQDGWMDR